VFDKVMVTYRGARYEIGRARDFYGIWTVGASRSQPLQWWPETSQGWSAAWARFTEIEAPGTIVPVGRRTPPVPQIPAQAGESSAQATEYPAQAVESPTQAAQGPAQAVESQAAAVEPPAPVPAYVVGSVVPPGADTGSIGGPGWARDTADMQRAPAMTGPMLGPMAGSRAGSALVAVSLLGLGVILGIAGLFPHYLGGASLAQSNVELVPHAIYLAAWTAAAVLIGLGGTRLRLGALLGAGLSAVTFGLFFADAGTAIADGTHVTGWGLWLSLAGWLACAAGSVLALLRRPASPPPVYAQPVVRGRFSWRRPRGAELGPAVMLVLAGLGVAAAFAPSWDSYTLHTGAGQSLGYTVGNAFSNPAPVIAGNVAVMVALAAVVIAAAFWRPR
jgi:hypothetical protein